MKFKVKTMFNLKKSLKKKKAVNQKLNESFGGRRAHPFSGLFGSYVKLAFRKLRTQKAYSFMNIAGLAIGMACFIILALWIQDELSYDWFHEKKDQIFRIAIKDTDNKKTYHTSWLLAPSLKANYPEIIDFCRIRFKNASLVQYGDLRYHEQRFYLADPSIFRIFTFPFLEGDPSTALSELNSIVITEETASRYFGRDNPIGKQLHVHQFNADFTVTGVIKNIPGNSHIQFDLITRIEWMGKQRLESWDPSGFSYVMLHPSSSAGRVNHRIQSFFREYVNPQSSQMLFLQPLTRVHLEGVEETGTNRQVFLFAILAVFVLILACINYTNLSTSRSIKKAKEVGIRKVIGATRQKIVIQYYGETVFLSFLALFSALAAVLLALPSVNRILGMKLRAIGMTNGFFCLILLGLVLLTGILAGSYPAVFLSAFRPARVLKGNFNLGSRGMSFRKILITFQFSIAIGLVICSIVVYKQLHLIKGINIRFNRDSVVTVSNNQELMTKFEKFKEALIEEPDVLNVTASSSRPFLVRDEVNIRLGGQPENKSFPVTYSMVDYDFFETFEMEIIQGTGFLKNAPEDRTKTCVINESAARMMGIEFPLGKKVRFDHPDFAEAYKELEIVGVVKDFHFRSMHQAIGPFIFRFYRPWHFRVFIKLKPGNVQETLKKIENIFKKFTPSHPFYYEFLDDAFYELYQAEIQMGYIFSFFGVIAICISCLGLFGLTSYTIEQKTKEIGIRKIFGATVRGIAFSLSKEMTQGVLIANLITWPIVYLVMDRWLQNFAYRINLGLDVFILSGLLAQFIALMTIALKTVRAAATDPVEPLRHE
jgi:ABC-type antimicrobial peptide transport system permease subunit